MGEVRVKVRLTNGVDAVTSFHAGPEGKAPRFVEIDAMVDTGAVCSVVPLAVLEKLGVDRYDTRVAQYADGRREEVGLSEPLLFEIAGRKTFEEVMMFGDEVLIGQTVLEKTDLLVDCAGKQVIPNPAHPKGPVLNVKLVKSPSLS